MTVDGLLRSIDFESVRVKSTSLLGRLLRIRVYLELAEWTDGYHASALIKNSSPYIVASWYTEQEATNGFRDLVEKLRSGDYRLHIRKKEEIELRV